MYLKDIELARQLKEEVWGFEYVGVPFEDGNSE